MRGEEEGGGGELLRKRGIVREAAGEVGVGGDFTRTAKGGGPGAREGDNINVEGEDNGTAKGGGTGAREGDNINVEGEDNGTGKGGGAWGRDGDGIEKGTLVDRDDGDRNTETSPVLGREEVGSQEGEGGLLGFTGGAGKMETEGEGEGEMDVGRSREEPGKGDTRIVEIRETGLLNPYAHKYKLSLGNYILSLIY